MPLLAVAAGSVLTVYQLSLSLKKLEADVGNIDVKLTQLLNALTGLPLVARSAAASVRVVAGGNALPQMFTWTPAEVRDLLRRMDMSQYAEALAPLGGAALLGLDDTGLARLGVQLPDHRELLLAAFRAHARAEA